MSSGRQSRRVGSFLGRGWCAAFLSVAFLFVSVCAPPRGTAIVIPYSTETVGHGSHTKAVLWKNDLAGLLRSTDTNPP